MDTIEAIMKSSTKGNMPYPRALRANVIHMAQVDTDFHVILADTTGVVKLMYKDKKLTEKFSDQ